MHVQVYSAVQKKNDRPSPMSRDAGPNAANELATKACKEGSKSSRGNAVQKRMRMLDDVIDQRCRTRLSRNINDRRHNA